jgi:predicted nucleic acid-binding protein
MALIDASVWIDYFANRATAGVDELDRRLMEGNFVYTCGVVYTEVLQGIRHDAEYHTVQSLFDELIYLPMRRRMFLAAADIYRRLRRKGIMVRKSVDCMIAAVAIEYDRPCCTTTTTSTRSPPTAD